MVKNRVYIKTYGCQMNERDSEAVAAMLRNKGYSIVAEELDADIILLNTCSVRDQAEQKAIGKTGQLMKRKAKNPNLLIGIMGCMAQSKGTAIIDTFPDLDLLIGTQKFHRVPDHLDNIRQTLAALGPRPSTVVDLEEEAGSQNTIRDHYTNGKERQISAFVSIMQGCNMNCSYCNVPNTRGEERSRSIEAIIEEIQALAEGGTREVTLLGQIVNSYGRRDIPFKNGKSPFVQLLEAVNAMEAIKRIRFTSPHPTGFKQDLIQAFKEMPKLGEYVHLPAQSGSNKILKAMNRPYTVERYCQIIEDLRKVVGRMHFSTDIIVGYPGETDEDFNQTVALFEHIQFDMAYIFKYSVRPNTPGVSLGDPIPKEVKEERNQILLAALKKSSTACNERYIGKTEEVLVEGQAKRSESMYIGKTTTFRNVIFKGTDRLIGECVPVTIERATASALYGELALQGV